MKTRKNKCDTTAQDIVKDLTEPDADIGFFGWLLAHKGMGTKWARHLEWNIGKLLREENCPFPTKKDAEHIAVSILKSDYSKSHQRHLLQALEYFCEWRDISIKFKKPRPTKRSPKYLTQPQLKALIRSCRDYREYTAITLFCTTGIRLNELRMLDVGDVHVDQKYITVRHAKRDRDREIPICEETCRIIQGYLHKYHPKSKMNTPLFLSRRSTRWSAHAISDAIKRCAIRANIEIVVSPHVLRHSFATIMLNNGCDINNLSNILGHRDISTTSIYLHINSEARRAAYNKGVPKL